jgi:hypothetical protein
MHMTAIQAETERNRLDRSARCAEKRHRRAGMQRVCGPIRPTWDVRATTDAARGGKRLIRWRSQAILTSEGRPLGVCSLKYIDNLKLNFSLMHSAKVIFLQVPKLNKNFKWIIDGVCGTIHDELL